MELTEVFCFNFTDFFVCFFKLWYCANCFSHPVMEGRVYHCLLFFILFYFGLIFIQRPFFLLLEREKGRGKERNIDVRETHWLATFLYQGIKPITQARAQTSNRTCDPSVNGTMLQPIEPHQPGLFFILFWQLIFIKDFSVVPITIPIWNLSYITSRVCILNVSSWNANEIKLYVII